MSRTRLALAGLSLAFLAVGGPRAAAQANAANYAFTTTTSGSLTDMSTGTIQLVAANQDDTASAVTLLGFEFVYMGVRQDRFSVNSNGLLRFGPTLVQTTTPYKPLGQAGFPLVAPYGADQRTHTTGRVHFKVIGSAPNRVAVIEWLNMQSNFNAGGTVDLTYQMRLSETTGQIEFVYGSMTMSTLGAADVNSRDPHIGFSSSNVAGTVGSVTAPQSGVPAPTFNGASNDPTENLYAAGAITTLSSAVDGSRRTFSLLPPTPTAASGINFTGVTPIAMNVNWTDSPDELGYLIYSSTDGGTSFSFSGALPQNAATFPASGLTPSTTYTWNVVAISEGGTAVLTGSQATAPPGNAQSLGSGLWSNPATWGGAVPLASDNVTIAAGHTVTVDTAAVAFTVTVQGTAVLDYEAVAARTLTVGSNVTVAGGGTLQTAATGTVTGHVLTVGGNLTVDGTLDFSTNADTAGGGITFTGAASATASGTGSIDVRALTMNKGTSSASVLELMPAAFTVRGVTTDVAGFLTITNGTLKISGSFTGTNRLFLAAVYTIPATGGLWLNNPNYTVAGTASGTTTSNNGLFRLTQGIYNVGVGIADGMNGGAGAVFIIEGGTLNASGRMDIQGAVTYTQSAGTVNVAVVGNSRSNFASFELFSTASTFNMSGGTINIINRNTGATQVDYQVRSLTFNVTGGLVVFGAGAAPPATTYMIRNVGIITNFTVNPTMTVNLNAATVFLRGTTVINNGAITSTGAARFDFGASAPMSYSGSGTFGTLVAPFGTTGVSANSTSLTTLGAPIVTVRVNLFQGGFVGSGQITLGNGGASTTVVQIGAAGLTTPGGSFDVSPVHNQGTGGEIILYAFETAPRTTGFEVNPTRILSRISVDNPNDLTVAGGDLTLTTAAVAPNNALILTNGRVVTGVNTVYVSSPAGVVTRTNGFVDGNLRKAYGAVANKTFEIGTANGFTPVAVNVTAGTFPADFTAAAVQSTVPGIFPPTSAISRYWRLTATGLTADLTLNYLDPADIPGTVTEANLIAYRQDPGGFTPMGGTVNTAANNLVVTGVTQFSNWTLAEPGATASTDLAITKDDGVTNATPGGSTTYTITASNNGLFDTTATVADTFAGTLTCTWTCAGSGGGTCTGAGAGDINDAVTLPVGGSVTYTAPCTISGAATGTLVNTATVTGALPDLAGGNNSATDTDTLGASADASITKTDGVTTATPGGSTTYTITASNAGPSNTTATVADTFPAILSCTWTCVGAGGGTCTAAGAGDINDSVNLPTGGSVTYTASCTISASATGSLVNTATVTAAVSDPNAGNNSATDTDTLVPSADGAITKTDGVTTVTAGGSTTYTITASNSGPSNTTGTVADTFDAVLTCTWTCVGAGGGTCTAAGAGNINDPVNLPAGGSVTYTAPCTISVSATGSLVNTATVTTAASDPVPGNNSATDTDTVLATADASITKTDGLGTATPGGSTTYTITASNAGPLATGATVADTFPAGCSSVSWTCVGSGGGTCTGAGVGNINDSVNLPSGGSVTYTATCNIAASATGTLSNTATVTTVVNDPNAGNNSATDSDTLTPSADLTLTKVDTEDPIGVHRDLTYLVTVSNGGPSDAQGLLLTDTLPAGLSFVSSTPGTPTCGEAAGTVTCNLGSLAAGSNTTVTIVARTSTTGTPNNTASVSAATSDPTPGNNDASASTTVKFLKGDQDNDLNTDIYLANTTSNNHHVWFMVGVTRVAELPINPTPPSPSTNRVVGVDDFGGDFRNDLVHWNSATGAVEFWLMNGVDRIGAPVPISGAPTLAPNWKLSATADFDADDKPDLVWRNTISQKIVLWTMNGTAKVGNIIPTPDQAVHANWEIVAAIDLNADGNTDFLWYNSTSGKIVYWWMDANVVRITGNFTVPDSAGNNNWKVLAAGDYGVGSGGSPDTIDIVWRNESSGRFVVWYMDTAGNRTNGVFTIPNQPDTNPTEWVIVGPR